MENLKHCLGVWWDWGVEWVMGWRKKGGKEFTCTKAFSIESVIQIHKTTRYAWTNLQDFKLCRNINFPSSSPSPSYSSDVWDVWGIFPSSLCCLLHGMEMFCFSSPTLWGSFSSIYSSMLFISSEIRGVWKSFLFSIFEMKEVLKLLWSFFSSFSSFYFSSHKGWEWFCVRV